LIGARDFAHPLHGGLCDPHEIAEQQWSVTVYRESC
jgi:hypothetical protein